MAPAAHRRRRPAPDYARVASALVAAVAVPAMALAGTGTPVTAHPITMSPDDTGTSPTAEPTPTGPTPDPTATGPSVGPTPSGSPTTDPPADPPPTRPPVGVPPPTQSSYEPPRPFPPRSEARGPGPAAPTKPRQPRLGVLVSTGDVVVSDSYWHHAATLVDLWVTAENTGRVTERVRLRYALPPGVTDDGTPGCGPAGPGSYECAAWTADAGARWSTRLRLRIAGDAWKALPLSGSVQVTATAPSHPRAGEVGDEQGFVVLLPPGGAATGAAGGLAAGGRPAGGASDVRHLAITLIGVSALLVVLALTLAVTALRRRLDEDPLLPTTRIASID